MIMSKKPWANPEHERCEFFVINPKAYKGKWKDFFGNAQPIYLELGCGQGTFMAVDGCDNQAINYIVIDKKEVVFGVSNRNNEKAHK